MAVRAGDEGGTWGVDTFLALQNRKYEMLILPDIIPDLQSLGTVPIRKETPEERVCHR